MDIRTFRNNMRVLVFYPVLSINTGSGIRAALIIDGLLSLGLSIGVVSDGLPESLENRVTFYPASEPKQWSTALQEALSTFRPEVILGVTEAGSETVADFGRRSGIPVVLDLHGLGFVECLEMEGALLPRLYGIYASLKQLLKIRSVAAVTVANPTLFPVLKPFTKITLPLLGMTDVERFCPDGPEAAIGSDPSRIQVLYAGNFRKWQGVDLLIDAIGLLGEAGERFEFTFLGSFGRDRSRVERWQRMLPGGRVHFLDAVVPEKVAEYCRAADVLVIPRPFMLSTYLALPQKLLDYMAVGGCIVATDLAPHRWALGDGAGVLCALNAKGIAKALLAAADPDLRRSVGQRARSRAIDWFGHRGQCSKLAALLDEVSAGR
jgi:glycosyltransferase involved in cell wall biosynthesis